MKRSGRISIVLLAAVVLVAGAVLMLFLLAGESPSGVAGKFLIALAKGDAKTLSKLTYMDGVSEPDIEKKWQKTRELTKYWMFGYQIKDTKEQSKDSASVILGWVKNATSQSAYEEKFELPMIKVDGKWKVDVRGMSREMFPSLPR